MKAELISMDQNESTLKTRSIVSKSRPFNNHVSSPINDITDISFEAILTRTLGCEYKGTLEKRRIGAILLFFF